MGGVSGLVARSELPLGNRSILLPWRRLGGIWGGGEAGGLGSRLEKPSVECSGVRGLLELDPLGENSANAIITICSDSKYF